MAEIVRLGVLSMPEAQGGFVGDPTSLACNNIYCYVLFFRDMILQGYNMGLNVFVGTSMVHMD